MLHGGIGTGTYHWSLQAEAPRGLFQIHLPDLPGHGRTALNDPEVYTLDVLVEAVEAYVSRLRPPVHVAGFSLGGHAALALAARRPELFASLVLIGVSIRDHQGLHEWREHFHPDRLERVYPFWAKQLSRLHAPLGGPDAWRDVCLRDSAGVQADLDPEELAAFDAPTLLIRGDRDTAVQPEQYPLLRDLWKQSDEAVIPVGGHDVQLTRGALVQSALRDFYDRVLDH